MNSTAAGQGKLKHAPPFLFILLAGAFTYGLIRLFSLQFASGEVYPEFSSLRAEIGRAHV